MKIVVLSDTHMPKKASRLPDRLVSALQEADQIIHAGDWQTPDVFEELSRFAPVTGVYGNVDGEDMKEIVPKRQLVTWAGYSIGVVHGHGEKKTTEKRAVEAFQEHPPDLIIYGHSHIPVLRYFKKTLLFNPGSVTDKRRLPFYSFGMLTLGEEGIHAEHIFFH
ncbi:metallophosphoesterase [Halobacillus kuroshimensis]|uniref:Phosphoesterase n=1 Tax=Halobacillus kuroshimensis TaxID=302481 RepID=A0ABS3DYS3_9BACI|nr:metallophosphoesterase [Halobacillus kuroshimensis]MBN8236493.1 metallophosphoesterase [Halobacillus kuroshimensis]